MLAQAKGAYAKLKKDIMGANKGQDRNDVALAHEDQLIAAVKSFGGGFAGIAIEKLKDQASEKAEREKFKEDLADLVVAYVEFDHAFENAKDLASISQAATDSYALATKAKAFHDNHAIDIGAMTAEIKTKIESAKEAVKPTEDENMLTRVPKQTAIGALNLILKVLPK